jgi:hypothetical protein
MNDTPPEIEKLVRERYMQMSGEQRFMIGVHMFETARRIALSSLPKGLSDEQRRRLLCERFYKDLALKVFP